MEEINLKNKAKIHKIKTYKQPQVRSVKLKMVS